MSERLHYGARVPVTPGTTEQHRSALERRLLTGAPLAPAPTGPVLEQFDARDLATILEHVALSSQDQGLTKVRIDMNITDAIALARYLRRAALAGIGE